MSREEGTCLQVSAIEEARQELLVDATVKKSYLMLLKKHSLS